MLEFFGKFSSVIRKTNTPISVNRNEKFYYNLPATKVCTVTLHKVTWRKLVKYRQASDYLEYYTRSGFVNM